MKSIMFMIVLSTFTFAGSSYIACAQMTKTVTSIEACSSDTGPPQVAILQQLV